MDYRLKMNRLQDLFASGKKDLLSIYYTAGYPTLNSTVAIAEALEKAGADFLEIGFPYSDPVADGPTIQESSQKALDSGMNLNILFEQLADLRKRVSIPVILMGYANPMIQYGVERFCKKSAEVGVDGVIVPDLPMHEYEQLYSRFFKDNDLSNIILVTPQTSDERIQKIDALSDSFIYLLSSSSITGKSLDVNDVVDTYFKRIEDMQLKNPTIVGFGIANKTSYQKACTHHRGAIVGSAFVKYLGATENYLEGIGNFISQFKG